MQLALLSEKYPPDVGGLAVSAARLAHALARAGHGVRVSVPGAELAPGQTEEAGAGGVRATRFGPHPRADDTLAAWFDLLLAQHARHAFDLLHAYYVPQAGFVAAYLGRYLGLPSVVSARGNDLDRAVFSPGKAAHILYALRHASALTANSRDLQRKAQALAPERAVALIPNGVDSAHFAPAARDEALARALGLGDLPVLGFVGEARAKKGLAPLLLAYREIARARPAALLLAGGVRGGDKDTLRVFQKQHPDLPLIVAPPVPPEALPAYYNLLDLLLLPALRDGLPNALLEGMACARCVVATPVGGIPDALRDGENGRLVPPGDPAALAAACLDLLADPAQRARLGQAARETVLRDFTLEAELRANEAVYHGLLGRAVEGEGREGRGEGKH